MSRERESEAREVLRRHVREAHGFERVHRDHEDTLVAAMLEFAAPSTSVQSAAPTLYETADSLKVAQALRERCARVAEGCNDGLTTTHTKIATAIRAIEIKGEEG